VQQFTTKGLANMFSTPKDTNEWKSVNARPQTSVSVNRNVSIGNIKDKNENFIKPKVVSDQGQGKIVDMRPVTNKKKK